MSFGRIVGGECDKRFTKFCQFGDNQTDSQRVAPNGEVLGVASSERRSNIKTILSERRIAMRRLAKFLFEGAMLKRLERTGYAYLGTGKENIAAHSFGVSLTALLLASLTPEADENKLLKMALLHDFLEARTGDLNSVNKLYATVDESAAAEDAFEGLPQGEAWRKLWEEYREAQSLEAQLVHDADQLDLLIMLKEQKDLGNPYASRWITYARNRLRTEIGRRLAEAICDTDWASWWLDQFVAREEDGKG